MIIALIIAVLLVAALIFYFFSSETTKEDQYAETEIRRIAKQIIRERDNLDSLRRDIEIKKSELALERKLTYERVTFIELKQLHYNSRMAGDSWYRTLESAKSSRKEIRKHIDSLKTSRRYHARRRNSSRGGKKVYHAQSGRAITLSIDGLYSALSDLRGEINLIRGELEQHNQNTARIRDYIGGNCGNEGRQWYQQLMQRTERRRKELPGSSYQY